MFAASGMQGYWQPGTTLAFFLGLQLDAREINICPQGSLPLLITQVLCFSFLEGNLGLPLTVLEPNYVLLNKFYKGYAIFN